jgi:4-hydroxy-3-methylbut-2-en-1-yl diphosphate reductase
VQNAEAMNWRLLDGVSTVAVSAGASAPEELVEELINACCARFAVTVKEVEVVKEDVFFKTPPIPLRHAS